MHADLIAAIQAGRPRVHLVTVTLADHTIRWADAGSVPWGADTYAAHDATYGALESIGEIADGIDDDASPVSMVVIPPTLASIADITAADAQGGRVTIHLGAVGTDGLLVSEPYRLYIGELDQPRLRNGLTRKLEYDIITGEARGLQPNEEQRQTDAFHKLRWPGEKGQEFATEGTKLAYWRADEPKRPIGILQGRGSDDLDDKAIQFAYRPDAPFAFPFGTVGLSGEARYQIGYGPTNRWFSIFATVAASGPVEQLISASFDDEVTTFDASDRSTNGEHAGEMWFKFLPGDQPSAALTSPTGTNAAGIPATDWTTDHKLSGSACYCWTGKENSKESEYRGGAAKPLLKIKGLKGWDPRLDSTWPGGSGACRLLDPSTWVWIEDGAIADLNWCIGRWEGAGTDDPLSYGVPYDSFLVGGVGAPLDLIDVESFIAAADIADTNVWKVAGVPYSDQDKNDVREDLLQSAGAHRARKGGMLSCVPYGAVQSSVLTVTEADTAAPVEIALAPSRLERKNTGIAEYWSPDHRYEMTPIQAVSDAAWVAADGGRQTEGFTYRYVPSANQAAQLCYYELARNRQPTSEVEFKPYMLQLEAGDCFTWDAPEFLLDGVKAKVEKRAYSPSSGLVKITFRPEIDAVHTAALALTGTSPGAGTPGSPGDDTVDDPTDFSSTVSGDEVTLEWTVGEANYFRTLILISDTNVFSTATQIASRGHLAGTTQTFVHKPGPGTWYYWVQGRSYEYDLSNEVGPETAVVAAPAVDWTTDVTNRPANLAALTGAEDVDNDTLQSALTAGTVKPAEAVTFTGKGDLAEKNVVDTADIAPDAISHYASAFTEANLAYDGSGYDVAQTVTLTTTGGAVEINASVIFSGNDPTTGLSAILAIERDGVSVWGPYSVAESYTTATGAQSLIKTVSLTIPDVPAAGSHTWDLLFLYTSGSAKNVRSRFLSVREMKTET